MSEKPQKKCKQNKAIRQQKGLEITSPDSVVHSIGLATNESIYQRRQR